MRRGFSRAGFTLIELSLSIAFIGILSVTIALIISDTVASYRRGLTLNQINTTGMDLVDDMRAAVQNSSANSVKSLCASFYSTSSIRSQCENDGARNFVSVERLATVKVGNEQISNVPVFGAFCTGTYSYIWNSGYFYSNYNADYEVVGVSPAILKYRNADGAVVTVDQSERSSDPFRLLKVRDNARAVCISAVLTNYTDASKYRVQRNDYTSGPLINSGSNVFDISDEKYQAVTEEPVDVLLSDEENSLVLYDLRSATPAQSNASNNLYYSVSFILATIQGGINVKTKGNYCAPPEDYEVENFDYCAINKFNFAVQATGE